MNNIKTNDPILKTGKRLKHTLYKRRYTNKLSILSIRERQFKTTMRYDFILTKMTKIK